MEYPDNTRDGMTAGADLSGHHTQVKKAPLHGVASLAIKTPFARSLWQHIPLKELPPQAPEFVGIGVDPARDDSADAFAYTLQAPVKDTNPKDAVASSKVPLWLLSPIAKAMWALAQFAGMAKYGAWNWRVSGVRSSVYLSAMQRHQDAYVSGEEFDPEDGTHHLGNVMACCAILLDARAAGKLIDDRPPSVDLRPTYRGIEAQAALLKDKYRDRNPRHCTITDTVQKGE